MAVEGMLELVSKYTLAKKKILIIFLDSSTI
jgi:hypothetical protein